MEEQEREDQESYFLPAQDQRVFGAGIKRKRVPFVPASTAENTTHPPKTAQAAGDRYLSIVMKQQPDDPNVSHQADLNPDPCPPPTDAQTSPLICEICNQPITPYPQNSHESSIPHQLSLPHTHPPSHLPRTHIGLRYLSTHGWDPDSRLGLGATGSGIRVPIRAAVKNNTLGLGVEVRREKKDGMSNKGELKRLNAKEVRKKDIEERKKAERLRVGFYGRDLGEYLGPDG